MRSDEAPLSVCEQQQVVTMAEVTVAGCPSARQPTQLRPLQQVEPQRSLVSGTVPCKEGTVA